MRVVIIWREESDYGREVREWLHDFERQTGKEIESVNPDEPEGISIGKTYDVVEYPTILAFRDNGELLQMWRGRELPRMSEVSYYLMDN
ncbi:hypothetical protein IKF15_02405 [Candidatus Saccharibacteria bacterium]|nr:hypothetical protein [Candidatus Saccharibacteria bacterium]